MINKVQLSNGQKKIELPSLSEILSYERIKLNVRVDNWCEAIYEVGKVLYDTDAITENYIDEMIKTAEELGPYIVIAPGIALPHASPESGAKKTALGMIKLSKPINFGNPVNDPVKLVFGLSAVDNKVHVKALQVLAKLFLSKVLVKELFEVQSIDSVMKIIQKAEMLP
ncbi:Ascorbate-specific PTS system EIIA component [subsurface metagenome]